MRFAKNHSEQCHLKLKVEQIYFKTTIKFLEQNFIKNIKLSLHCSLQVHFFLNLLQILRQMHDLLFRINVGISTFKCFCLFKRKLHKVTVTS